jgi:hypothetical protein
MTTSEDAIPESAGLRVISIRKWLGRFPLSILLPGMRIGVGMVFFNNYLINRYFSSQS